MSFFKNLFSSKAMMGTSNLKLYEPDVFTEKATFAMACFWGPDARFGCTPGVIRTRVGYCGGDTPNPNYRKIGDHTETVDIDFDPNVVTYSQLLGMFWKHHDPTERNKRQYTSIIFIHNEEQKKLAEETLKEQESKQQGHIVTAIIPSKTFYNAEDYHQKYRLQQFPEIVQSLGLTPSTVLKSHVAARLNGYVAGYGSMDAFEKEWEKLGLDENTANFVRNSIKTYYGKRDNVC